MNSVIASMGYDLPVAIGACAANGYRELVCRPETAAFR